MDGSKRQLAVYAGHEVAEYTCGYFASSWSPRLFIAPEEYLSYGIGGVHNLTTKPNDPNTSRKEYKIQDHLGNTRVVLDGTGAVIGQYDYTPFGGILWQSAPTPRLSFIDKEKDKETNLSNFGVRNYSDELGRFMSVDVLWEKYRSLTPYHYSANNPLRFKDPDGRVMRDKDGNVVFIPVATGEYIHDSGEKADNITVGYIITNNGNYVQSFQNETSDERFDTDCAGACFADGKLWIEATETDKILQGDQYAKVEDKKEAQKGDVAVYRDKKGEVQHVATVSGKDKKGNIMVESLGGLETKTETKTIKNAWKKGGTVELWRKTQGDGSISDEEIQKRTKELQQ